MTKTTTTATSNTAGLPWVDVKASTNMADGSSLPIVLLRVLVRWLMESKKIAFMGAARELHGALQGLAGLRLYVTAESGAARVVGAADTFNLLPVQRRIYSHGIGLGQRAAPAPASLPDGVTPGMPAALHYVGNVWGGGACLESILDDDNNPASRLAMPCDQAAAIWGGVATIVVVESLPLVIAEPTTWQELTEFRKKSLQPDWTQSQKSIVSTESTIRKNVPGSKGVAIAMAKELGITVSRLNDLIRTAKEFGMREKKRKATG